MATRQRSATRTGVVLLLALAWVALLAAPASASAFLTIEAPQPGGETGSSPVIRGSTAALDTAPVQVAIHEGSSAGPIVLTLEESPNEGKWSVQVSKDEALSGATTYTAVAKQSEEGSGSEEASVTFTVVTEPPLVKLNAPAARSSDTEPTFSGTGSEKGTEVVVRVSEGGKEVGKGHTTVAAGGSWSAGLEAPLPSGRHSFSAVAIERSGLGNPDGESEEYGFEVDTLAPTVTLDQPTALSSDTEPTFSGTGSEEGTEVQVHVLEGGKEVGKGHTTVSAGGTWSTGLEKALPSGDRRFTVIAREKSSLAHNPEGESEERAFEVDTLAPVVTLGAPPARSSDTEPTFSGTGSEEGTEVVVRVLEGAKEVGKGHTTVSAGGTWSTGLEAPLPEGKHSFTVIAKEKSAITGGPEGESEERSFELDTLAPAVTLAAPSARTSNTEPTFSGTGSEDGTEVMVRVMEGGKEVGKGHTKVSSGGAWSTGLEAPLPSGKHSLTVVAKEKSGLPGNPEGESEERSFELDTVAPTVTLSAPPARSRDTTPTFSGTGSEEGTEVVVRVLEGAKEVGKGHTTVSAGGTWSTGLENALPSGDRSFTVLAQEKSGVFGAPTGESEERSFEVDTLPPTVTLNAPPARTSETKPMFSGTGSEEGTEVVVRVLEGSKEVGRGHTAVSSAGTWSAGLESALPGGERHLTVIAKEKSGLTGNAEGESETRSFELDTLGPTVTLAEPPARTSSTKPIFSGTGSENGTEVVVHVMEGTQEVDKGHATVSGKAWSAGLEAALPSGRHSFTVVAKEKSGLTDNPEGESETRSFEVDTVAPTVTLSAPPARSSDTEPTFSGTGSEEGTEVVVRVLEGAKEVGKGHTTVSSGGTWSAGLEKALPSGRHVFTVRAIEQSGVSGAPAGESLERSFELDTLAPTVTLAAPPARSSDTTPTFSGTGSENGTEVVVRVLEGVKEVGKGHTTVSGETWSVGLEGPLPSGRHSFTVVAKEKSGLTDNPEGESETRSFEVDTLAPAVTLSEPPARTGDTTPTFSGTGSENGTEVVVRVLEGGKEVGKGHTTVSGKAWSAGLEAALPSGRHSFTVVAKEKSGLTDNPEGESETRSFEVDTLPPTVTLAQPPARSRDTTPTFSGTGSEEGTEVVVRVLENGKEVGKGHTTVASGGTWSAGLEKALAAGQHSYTVIAKEKSGIVEDPEGSSEERSFEVDTLAPTVTLSAPPARSSDTEPTFSGTGSEEGTEVVVRVFEGAKEVGKGHTTVSSGGTWSAGLEKALPTGKHSFTVVATEQSGIIGNPAGESEERSFELDTLAPTVTLAQPPARSNNPKPVFSGTGSENGTEVIVHVMEGGKEVGKGHTTVSGKAWSVGLEAALPSGRHSFTVVATEQSGLPNNPAGESEERSFELDMLAPTVTLNEPPALTNDTTPTFSGTGSEEGTEVQVRVLEGSQEVGKGHTIVAAGGGWSAELEKALPGGKHSLTVVAIEQSALAGNPAGESAVRSFELDTLGPVITLARPPARSSNTEPVFSGTGSENGTEVVVRVFEGAKEVDKGHTTVTANSWSAGLEKALAAGQHSYTVIAKEKSSLAHNPEGESEQRSFEVDTLAPTVTLAAPPSRTNNPTPTFSGTGSEEGTEVQVRVLEGTEEVGKGHTTVSASGTWSAGLEQALPTGKHSFTVVASEKSGIAGNPTGESEKRSFELDMLPPTVTLAALPARSSDTTPTFSGSGSENGTEVVVHVMEAGKEVDKGHTTVVSKEWSASLEKPLPSGERKFTVVAVEQSGLAGNPAGESETRSIEVDTLPPTVTLAQPARTNNTTPTFSGTGSEEGTEVVVRVLEGAKEVDKGHTTVSGKTWSMGLEKALPSGEHTFKVIATEKSALANNPSGESEERSFELDTLAPKVTLAQPPARSNVTTPTFSGTGSEEGTEVVVHVMEGTKEVGKGHTTVSGKAWSASLEAPLPAGNRTFTVVAKEKSGLTNNPEGESETRSFEVNTLPPAVTLAQPPARSNVTTPTFSGTASEEGTEVVVHVMEGPKEVGKGHTTVSGKSWSTGLEGALPGGSHTFTVIAKEKSGLANNPEGQSETRTFEVDTLPPTITLEPLPEVSGNSTPTFSGTANETASVTVEVFKGSKPEGTRVATVLTPLSAGHYTTKVSTSLESGQYTAIASEPSSIGNEVGHSAPVTFEIETGAPTVELAKPPHESNNTAPAFSGTVVAPDSEKEKVTVFVRETSVNGPIVGKAEASVVKGKWQTGPVALTPGKRTYTAVASTPSALGNAVGKSAPVTFVVNTEPPEVEVTPPSAVSNNTKPTFSGTGSEEGTEVEVHVVEGEAQVLQGAKEVDRAHTIVSGKAWSATLEKALPEGDHTYTVYATEKSALCNAEGHCNPNGQSALKPFRIDTLVPEVRILSGPQETSTSRKPGFSGGASEDGEVIVDIYPGAKPEGQVATSLSAVVQNGEWFAGQVETPLEWGEYTAVAREASSIGNKGGESAPLRFVVAKIPPDVDTEAPSAVADTHAALFASVNPQGGPIGECYFEYGTTTSYGSKVGCGFTSGALVFPAAATGPVGVFVRVYGLKPTTTYHERIVAVGEGGTGIGSDETFTTVKEEEVEAGAASAQIIQTTDSETPHATGASGVAGLFAAQLKPSGKAAKIATLLRAGGYPQHLRAPEAGTASIKWYYLRRGAKLAGRGKHAPVLIASGKISFSAAGSAVMKIRLTSAGKQQLRRSSSLKLTARCAFTPLKGAPVTTTGTFTLKR